MPVAPFNLGNCKDPQATFLGTTQLEGSKTVFHLSQFAVAFESGDQVILLDELNRCDPESTNILLTALDQQGYLAADEMKGGRRIGRGPGISFFATANEGSAYTGTDQMDHALFDRMNAVIELDFPPVDKEARILVRRFPGLDSHDATRICEMAHAQRNLFKQGDFSTAISTRQLLAAAKRMSDDIPLETALRYCVANKFSADGDEESERAEIEKLIQAF